MNSVLKRIEALETRHSHECSCGASGLTGELRAIKDALCSKHGTFQSYDDLVIALLKRDFETHPEVRS